MSLQLTPRAPASPNLTGWWTINEAAAVAKIHPRTLHKWVREGRIRAFGPPRCTRVLLADILGERPCPSATPNSAK